MCKRQSCVGASINNLPYQDGPVACIFNSRIKGSFEPNRLILLSTVTKVAVVSCCREFVEACNQNAGLLH